MDVYIARQPIYDANFHPQAYELLYRNSSENRVENPLDGNQATKFLLSDAITVFGLKKLTNEKQAFVNFTRDLILSNFPLVLDPELMAIEILEDIIPDEPLVKRIAELKKLGYRIALDDYVGSPVFDSLLPYVDVIKVDFRLASMEQIRDIAIRFHLSPITLLAEKVETSEEFEKAKTLGYTLFQGYFFSKPKMISKKTASIADSSFVQIIRELGQDDPDFDQIATIIEQDATLTYRLLLRVNTIQFQSSSNHITAVRQAIVRLGLDEFRRWIVLMMARSYSAGVSDEVIRTAYARAVFSEKLAMASSTLRSRSADAFIMGMMSLIDVIMNEPMKYVLDDLPLSADVKDALLGGQNSFSEILQLVEHYEQADWNDVIQLETAQHFRLKSLSDCYLDCLTHADSVFDHS